MQLWPLRVESLIHCTSNWDSLIAEVIPISIIRNYKKRSEEESCILQHQDPRRLQFLKTEGNGGFCFPPFHQSTALRPWTPHFREPNSGLPHCFYPTERRVMGPKGYSYPEWRPPARLHSRHLEP